MSFWEIAEPTIDDYRHAHINGRIDHPYRLPSVRCEKCGKAVSKYYEVVLPFECPTKLRSDSRLTNDEASVSVTEFRQLAKTLSAEIGKRRIPLAQVSPEAYLQPGYLDVPSFPTLDFLWSSLRSGLSSAIVSKRIWAVLKERRLRGIEFYPVTGKKVGRRSSQVQPKIPTSGEPEDIAAPVHPKDITNRAVEYYQLIISAETDRLPGCTPGKSCAVCGQEENPDWSARQEAWDKLTTESLAQMSRGLDIFRVQGRGTIIVSAEFKLQMESLSATNLEFRLFPRPIPAVKARRTKRRSTD